MVVEKARKREKHGEHQVEIRKNWIKALVLGKEVCGVQQLPIKKEVCGVQ